MKKLNAFLNLVRWPNLLVLVFSQLFVHYFVIYTLAKISGNQLSLSIIQLSLLIVSTILIAAAGNIFNDLQDVLPDQLNKKAQVIGKEISAKQASVSYWLLNGLGLLLALWLAFQLNFMQLAFIQLFVIFFLRFYSLYLKQKVLLGNVLIALLTGFSIYIVYLYHLVALTNNPIELAGIQKQLPIIHLLVGAYAFFAFLTNLIREIIKDMEDVEGDRKFNIQTLVVKYGITKSRLIVRIFNALLAFSVLAFAWISFTFQWFYLAVYLIVAVFVPVVYFELQLKGASQKEQFHSLSQLSKMIMVAGILSMQIFSIQF